LPEEKKEALGIVYSFCRLADDIVDEGYSDAPQQLAILREAVDAAFENRASTELGRALQGVIQKYPIPKQYFLDVIDGVSRDLNTPVRFETYGDLKWYMYRVASAVGLMCIEIFGYTNPACKQYAEIMGYAVQMTNILRDIKEDAAINRIYLPKEDLDKFGLSEQDILKPAENTRLNDLLVFEAKRAQNYYDEARRLLPKEDFNSLMAARAMGNIYEAVLHKILKMPCRAAVKKIKLSKWEKFFILIKTWREDA